MVASLGGWRCGGRRIAHMHSAAGSAKSVHAGAAAQTRHCRVFSLFAAGGWCAQLLARQRHQCAENCARIGYQICCVWTGEAIHSAGRESTVVYLRAVSVMHRISISLYFLNIFCVADLLLAQRPVALASPASTRWKYWKPVWLYVRPANTKAFWMRPSKSIATKDSKVSTEAMYQICWAFYHTLASIWPFMKR